MELREYWSIIRRWMWMIVTITVIATLTSAVLSLYVIKPTYQATTTLLVNQKYSSSAMLSGLYNDVMTNEALVQTYSDIMKSNSILDKVISDLNLPYTAAQLSNMITVDSTNQSEVITLSVTSKNINEATQIANSLAKTFQQKVVQLMQVRNVQVVDPATVPSHPVPVSPKKSLNVSIAFILGLMVSVGLAFLIEYLDDSVRSDEEVALLLGTAVLGVIPTIESTTKKVPSASSEAHSVSA